MKRPNWQRARAKKQGTKETRQTAYEMQAPYKDGIILPSHRKILDDVKHELLSGIQCDKGRCYSPLACSGFGYCREKQGALMPDDPEIIVIDGDMISTEYRKVSRRVALRFYETKPKPLHVMTRQEYLARKAELEARGGVPRWDRLDPACYIPLYIGD